MSPCYIQGVCPTHGGPSMQATRCGCAWAHAAPGRESVLAMRLPPGYTRFEDALHPRGKGSVCVDRNKVIGRIEVHLN